MDDDQARQGKKAKAATAALILGAFGLAAAAALPGLLAVACGILWRHPGILRHLHRLRLQGRIQNALLLAGK